MDKNESKQKEIIQVYDSLNQQLTDCIKGKKRKDEIYNINANIYGPHIGLLILYIFLSTTYVTPILKLSKAALNLDNEQLPIDTSKSDELGQLGRAFKNMRSTVNNQKSKEEREAVLDLTRIAARKAGLQAAIAAGWEQGWKEGVLKRDSGKSD